MSTYDPISYQGPNKPPRAGAISNNGREGLEDVAFGEFGGGFFDLNVINALTSQIIKDVSDLVSEIELKLRSYSMIIPTADTALNSAYQMVFAVSATPNSSTTGYLHYFMYKQLLMMPDSNAAAYMKSRYEASIRDESGTNVLDILKLCLYLNNEAKRIQEFIVNYIGDLDDTSEFRVLESFQFWAEDAAIFTKRLRSAFQQETTGAIPSSELGTLNKQKASGSQTLLKIKLNAINKQLNILFSDMSKNFEMTADTFYDKYLGPAVKFRSKIGKDLNNELSSAVLAREVKLAIAGLEADFSATLADLIMRLSGFDDKATIILNYVIMRDTLVMYINQLSLVGVKVRNQFSNVDIPQSELVKFDNINLLENHHIDILFEDNFTKSHSELSNLDDSGAHPQYLLRSGGSITGNIDVLPGITIGGMNPAIHRHTGTDGTQKIHGTDIEINTVTADNVDSENASTSVPINLTVASQSIRIVPPGVAQVSIAIGFDVDISNIVSYEFEVTRIG